MNLQNNIDPATELRDSMIHADTLRDMAKTFMTVGSDERVDTCLAGADALEALDRVHHALDGIARVRSESEASARDDEELAEWHQATADALEYVIHLINDALGGDTK